MYAPCMSNTVMLFHAIPYSVICSPVVAGVSHSMEQVPAADDLSPRRAQTPNECMELSLPHQSGRAAQSPREDTAHVPQSKQDLSGLGFS